LFIASELLPPQASTSPAYIPDVSSVAVCSALGPTELLVLADHVSSTGLNIWYVLLIVPVLFKNPPYTITVPSGSSVAVWDERETVMGVVYFHTVYELTYSSHELSTFPLASLPPVTKMSPFGSSVVVCPLLGVSNSAWAGKAPASVIRNKNNILLSFFIWALNVCVLFVCKVKTTSVPFRKNGYKRVPRRRQRFACFGFVCPVYDIMVRICSGQYVYGLSPYAVRLFLHRYRAPSGECAGDCDSGGIGSF